MTSRQMQAAVLLLAGFVVTSCAREPDPPQPASHVAVVENTRGLVLSSGLSDAGQLGRPAPTSIKTAFGAVTLGSGALVGAVGLAGGDRHSLAVLSDGRVFAWGANEDGQLGDGTRNFSSVPVPVRAPDGGPGYLTGVVEVAANSNVSLARRHDGTVVAWGREDRGQRGNAGTSADPLLPSVVLDSTGAKPLSGVKAMAADGGTELALTVDGKLYGWGDNGYGQIGSTAGKRADLPVLVTDPSGKPLSGLRAIALGGQHAVAVLDDGQVLAWGRNDSNQLGNGERADRSEPSFVLAPNGKQPLTGVTAVSAAEKHTLALLSDGTVVAWGRNSDGQLGDRTTNARSLPVVVHGVGAQPKLQGVREVAAGESYSVALLGDGTLVSWGANGRGQLASGDRTHRRSPGSVTIEPGLPAPPRAATIGAGRRHLLVALR
jgi:alpha-tubulin suppressor-like RCC1 family protein